MTERQEATQPTIIPFLTPELEQQAVEEIVAMRKNGIVCVWDPGTCTAIYILIQIHGGLPRPVRWTLEGPVSRNHSLKVKEVLEKQAASNQNLVNPLILD